MNKLLIYFAFFVVFAIMGYQIYTTEKTRQALSNDLSNTNLEYQALVKDNAKLNDKIQYFSDSRNLEKEARAKLNYKVPGEKLIIVAPKQ